jgi:hypothetical protein
MAIPHSLRRWLRLPGRVALILGLGALSTAALPPTRAARSGDRVDNVPKSTVTCFISPGSVLPAPVIWGLGE